MKIILNNFEGSTTFKQALGELIEGAETLSVAVSYLQVGGWELFRDHTRGLDLPKMRIVCTDQLGITQPAAVERAIHSKVQIRNFVGNVLYHPKVFLAHDRNGRPTRFLLGSANLSTSAFSTSVEVSLLCEEKSALSTLNRWFNDLFDRNSAAFTPELLKAMEVKWRLAAAQRARNRLQVRGQLVVSAKTRAVPVAPEDLDTLEDVLATIQLPIGLLNMDYAANNVRNITKARDVMANPALAHTKQQSELKLLGFMQHGKLSALGSAAAVTRLNVDVARLWCQWLRQTSDAQFKGSQSQAVGRQAGLSAILAAQERCPRSFPRERSTSERPRDASNNRTPLQCPPSRARIVSGRHTDTFGSSPVKASTRLYPKRCCRLFQQ